MKKENISYFVSQKCCACKISLTCKNRNQNIRKISANNLQETRIFFNKHSIELEDYICNRCRLKFMRNKPLNDVFNPESSNLSQSLSVKASKNNPKKYLSDDDSLNTEVSNSLSLGKIIQLPTAYSSHKHCLMCNSTRNLRTVKPESIINAYLNHGIIIHFQSRCCDKHLDNRGVIYPTELKNTPTAVKAYQEKMILTFESCLEASKRIQHHLEQSSGVFDKFKDMTALDNELCIKITGWNKIQFTSFSKLITRVRDTCGRTKEQLIAIYKYWLSKGIDQASLAMFKTNTSQQQISHYLAQIKSAMNDEVVPVFLGANKGKEYLLNHNTTSVKVLHNLADDVLAVIADGTYTRLEKSSNNDFQYNSYSMQKSQNLVKPCIICCADGYFIDCYGPFKANLNDAQIFRHILHTDKDLIKLFEPPEKIIIFLDRGNLPESISYLLKNNCLNRFS